MTNATHRLVTNTAFAAIKRVVFYLLSHIYIYIYFFFFLSAKLRDTVA